MQFRQAGSVSEDFGKLVLRASVAILMLFHGVAKIFGGVAGITGMIGALGLPPMLGYFVYVGEVLAPLLVLFGILTRPAALVMAINMVVAIFLAHSGDLFSLTKNGGWALELQGLFLFSSIAVALLGAGRYSVRGTSGKWN